MKVVINLFNFFRHYKSPPFHSVIRIHFISLSYHILVILPSHFSSMEQMFMLMLCRIINVGVIFHSKCRVNESVAYLLNRIVLGANFASMNSLTLRSKYHANKITQFFTIYTFTSRYTIITVYTIIHDIYTLTTHRLL